MAVNDISKGEGEKIQRIYIDTCTVYADTDTDTDTDTYTN